MEDFNYIITALFILNILFSIFYISNSSKVLKEEKDKYKKIFIIDDIFYYMFCRSTKDISPLSIEDILLFKKYSIQEINKDIITISSVDKRILRKYTFYLHNYRLHKVQNSNISDIKLELENNQLTFKINTK